MSYELVAASNTDDSSFYGYLFALKSNPPRDMDDATKGVIRWFHGLDQNQKNQLMECVGKKRDYGKHDKYVKSTPMDRKKAKEVLSTWIATKLSFESLWSMGKLYARGAYNFSGILYSVATNEIKPTDEVDERLASPIEKTLRMNEDVKFALLSKDSNVLYDDSFWDGMCELVGEKKFNNDWAVFNKKVPQEVRTRRCAHKKIDTNFLETFNYGQALKEELLSYREDVVGVKRPYDDIYWFAKEVVKKNKQTRRVARGMAADVRLYPS